MKTYEQTVEEVFRRRAAYERERQRKKRVLRQLLGAFGGGFVPAARAHGGSGPAL